MKKLLMIALVAMVAGFAFGYAGIDDAYLEIDGSWYTLGPGYTGPYDLGTFELTDSLMLNEWNANTYKQWATSDGGPDNISGITLYYTIYETSSASSDTFTGVAGGFLSDVGGGDQKWGSELTGPDFLTGLSAGTQYTMEVYVQVSGSGFNDGSEYLKNGADNFAFTFETAAGADVVPEPTTMALLGLGAAAVALRRKLRK